MTRPRRLLPTSRPRHVFSALLLAAALALTTACGNQQSPGTSATEASTAVTVTDIDGNTRTIPAGKPAALFFFSVGCGECVGGAKSLSKAAEALGSSADYLLVDMDPKEPKTTVDGFRDYIKAPGLPSAIDTGAALTTRYRVTSLSTLVVVDANGNVTFRATDPSAEQIQAELTKAGTR
ncbi:TlpA family protein disulfide reductase [Arthrobacter sp. M4]|uniref:TlpA family protein disulfide reductase n=1 Tax=Arthrobacter sp. M4 TaxID=218160 RepID=UPI001CDC5137|nr:TlpA family protein disulfide reductase [Arthrobacter sp. M4]MCA4135457.1 TlpA family protein disulfide reductase [Arthrobacter sp. M4]